MAQAGFFRPFPRKRPDLAECYICLKPLEGWEEQDDPWTEHKAHMPSCPLSKLRDKGVDVNNLTVEQRIKLELERGKFLLVNDDRLYNTLLNLRIIINLTKTAKRLS